jgi:hypothetical protein
MRPGPMRRPLEPCRGDVCVSRYQTYLSSRQDTAPAGGEPTVKSGRTGSMNIYATVALLQIVDVTFIKFMIGGKSFPCCLCIKMLQAAWIIVEHS